MDPLLCYPDPLPRTLIQALDRGGYRFKAIASPVDVAVTQPDDGWSGAVIWAVDDPDGALSLCVHLRNADLPLRPLLLVVPPDRLDGLPVSEDLFDDFMVAPGSQGELDVRLAHLFFRTGLGSRPELIEYGPLVLNVETYQATLNGRHLELTYMEYELLRFLASSPGRVFTRETLLSRVWGYEYFGGARTVDVHIRRLRAKLGEEHAHLIQTVRSVGYRFGEPRWSGR
jgi:two-component system alkaline phosphatase synthesis response regulator PhoP